MSKGAQGELSSAHALRAKIKMLTEPEVCTGYTQGNIIHRLL